MKNVNTKRVLSSILSICLTFMLLFSTLVVSPAALFTSAGAEEKVEVTFNYQTGKYDVSGSIDNAEYFIVVWEYWNGTQFQKIDFKTVKAVSTGNLQYSIDRQVFLDVDKDGIFRVGATNYKSNPLSYIYSDSFTMDDQLLPVVTTDLEDEDLAVIKDAFGYEADEKDTLNGMADISEGGVNALHGDIYYNRSVNSAFSTNPAHFTGYYIPFKISLPEIFEGVVPADTVVKVDYTSKPGFTSGSLVSNQICGSDIFTDDEGNVAILLKNIDSSVQSINISIDWDGEETYYDALNYQIDLSNVVCVVYDASTAVITNDVADEFATPVGGFSGNDSNLIWVNDGEGGFVLKGQIWFNPYLTEACNTTDVDGYGMAFKVVATEGTEVTLENAQGDVISTEVVGSDGKLVYVWDVELGDIIYVTVDNDGEEGNLFKPTTYKLDLTKVVLQPEGEYSVVFVDADNSTVLGTTTLAIGDKVTTTPNSAKDGYSFEGWFVKNAAGAYEAYDFDAIYGYDILAKTTTIYACYDAFDYKVYFAANGADGTMATISGVYGDIITIPANTFTRFGYNFKGWKVAGATLKGTDGTVYNEGEIIESGVTVFALPTADDTNFVLTAQWELAVYTINYVLGVNVENNPDNPATYTVLDTVVFKNPSLAAGYAFTGWTLDGNPITGIEAGTMAEDITLVPTWDVLTFDIVVEHVFNGGYMASYVDDTSYAANFVGDTVLVAIDVPYGYTISESYLTTPTGAFYEFVEDVDVDNPIDQAFHITMPDKDLRLTVVYESLLHDVIVNNIYDGGEFDDADYQQELPGTFHAGSVVIIAADVLEGYAIDDLYFTGYTESGAFFEVLDVEYVVLSDGTFAFAMPNEPVIVNIVYKNINKNINVNYIFDDGITSTDTYYDGPAKANAGEKVIFSVNAPEDYAVSDVYATFGAGQAFVEVLPVESVAGAYYFTMPEEDVTIDVVFKNIRRSIEVQNIFLDGTTDDTDYFVGDKDALEGDVVVFSIDAPAKYAVDEIYATYGAGQAFVQVLPVESVAGAYYFTMPDDDVTITVVYKCVEFDVTINEFMGTDLYNTSYINGQITGSTVVVTPEIPDGYAIEEIYATVNLGVFDEVVDLTQSGTAYVFEMPDGNVTVSIYLKCVKHDVTIHGYVDGVLTTQEVIADQIAGTKVLVYPEVPAGYAIDEVFATTGFGTVFVEIIDLEQISDVYCFIMPEDAVEITVTFKQAWFDVNVIGIYNGDELNNTSYPNTEAGSTFVFSVTEIPGKMASNVYAVSAADDSVEYPVYQVGEGTYSMEMPEDDVVIYVEWVDAVVKMNIINVDEDGNVLYSYIDAAVRETVQYINLEDMLISTEYWLDYIPYDWYAYVDATPFVEYVDYVNYFNENTLVVNGLTTDLTVVIEWKKISYKATVRVMTVDSEIIAELSDIPFTAFDAMTLPVSIGVPEGYTLNDIFITAVRGVFGEPISYVTIEDIIMFVTPDADFTIDFVVEPINFTVDYYAYIDGEYKLFGTEDVKAGEKAQFGTTNTPEALEGGYKFIGWYNGDELYNFDSEVYGSLELIAVYDYDSFTVSFNSNGGSAVESQKVVFGGKAIDPAQPTKEGYDFDGWYNGDVKFDFATLITADIELTAKWTEKTFEVELPTGEGFTATPADGQPSSIKYGDDYSFTVTPEEGVDPETITVYVNGKPVDPTSGNNYTVENVTEPIVITVVVEKEGPAETYTVKFHYYDGENAAEITNEVLKGSDVTAPTDTYRYTYKFLGWFDNAEGNGTAVTDFTNIQADAEYFAIYEQNPLADYTFGTYTVKDSSYGMGFKEVTIEVVKNDAEYQDRDVYVVVMAQLKDGSTIVFYVPATIENGDASVEVSLILNSKTFTSADMYLVYDEVDLSGAINFVDVEPEIQLA